MMPTVERVIDWPAQGATCARAKGDLSVLIERQSAVAVVSIWISRQSKKTPCERLTRTHAAELIEPINNSRQRSDCGQIVWLQIAKAQAASSSDF